MLERWGAEAVVVHLYDDGLLWLPRTGDCICVPTAELHPSDAALAAVAVTLATSATISATVNRNPSTRAR
jgi:hypothetical protein